MECNVLRGNKNCISRVVFFNSQNPLCSCSWPFINAKMIKSSWCVGGTGINGIRIKHKYLLSSRRALLYKRNFSNFLGPCCCGPSFKSNLWFWLVLPIQKVITLCSKGASWRKNPQVLAMGAFRLLPNPKISQYNGFLPSDEPLEPSCCCY